jgi:16S rRNA (guanine1207-N2)-methyltransferase
MTSRLSHALAGFDWPDGRIAVFGPSAATDLSELPKDRVVVVQGFRPDHDAWAAAGLVVAPLLEGQAAAGLVCLNRARAAARAAVADAVAHLPPGAPVWVDGQKTDGIDTMLKDLRAKVALGEVKSKAHGKIACFASPGPGVFDDWTGKPTHPAPGFTAPPGAFSADGIDPASAMLSAALPAKLPGRVADLGAGWGWLSAQVLGCTGVTELHLVEADHASLQAARANVADERARFHWADATAFRPDQRVDAVVMNPPFHVGRDADPALGAAFIRSAAQMLTLSGTLYMVANRHLPYEPVLAQVFREVSAIAGDGRFKVLRAARPLVRRP